LARPTISYVQWWVTSGLASDSQLRTLPSNLPAGTYELRLYAHANYVRLAASNAISVQPIVTVGPAAVAPGGTIVAAWSGIQSPTATDWFAVTPIGNSDTQWLQWWYTTGTASGSQTKTLTSFVTPGTYELRLFANDSMTRLGVSNTFTVAATPPCSYFITPSSLSISASGQSGYVAVTTTGTGCASWTPGSGASWLTLGAPITDHVAAFNPRVLADQPVAFWAFHDTVGATAASDSTGRDQTAVLAGGAAVNVLGSVDLDGVSGRIIVPPSALLTMRYGLTAELWLQTTRQNARIIGAAGDPWELYVGTGGVLELRLLGQVIRGTHLVNDNVSHVVDATWDGAMAALYVDGVLDTQVAVSGILAGSAGGLTIGAHPTRGEYLSGRLQAVAVFDRGLTAAQIADRYLWETGQQSATSAVFAYTVSATSASSPRASAIHGGHEDHCRRASAGARLHGRGHADEPRRARHRTVGLPRRDHERSAVCNRPGHEQRELVDARRAHRRSMGRLRAAAAGGSAARVLSLR